jgi:hypothetical protein
MPRREIIAVGKVAVAGCIISTSLLWFNIDDSYHSMKRPRYLKHYTMEAAFQPSLNQEASPECDARVFSILDTTASQVSWLFYFIKMERGGDFFASALATQLSYNKVIESR